MIFANRTISGTYSGDSSIFKSLHLPIAGRSVLELGAGIGELTGFFVDRGCNLTATDARQESLNILRSQHPNVTAQVLDLDNPTGITDRFEVVFCYGLLYHLSRPAEAIKWMAERCSRMLLLETRVSYGSQEEVNPYLEVASSPTQAAHGRGCRPTRPWVFSRLREHFPYVYVPRTQPWRPHFPTDWVAVPDHDVLANAVFIGSRECLDQSLLSSELLMNQGR